MKSMREWVREKEKEKLRRVNEDICLYYCSNRDNDGETTFTASDIKPVNLWSLSWIPSSISNELHLKSSRKIKNSLKYYDCCCCVWGKWIFFLFKMKNEKHEISICSNGWGFMGELEVKHEENCGKNFTSTCHAI